MWENVSKIKYRQFEIMKTDVVFEINKRKIFMGKLVDDVFYVKKKYKLNQFDAFGFNFDLLKFLDEIGVKKIVVEYENEFYEIDLKKIWIYGFVKQFEGYEKQVFVKIENFKKQNEVKK